MPPHLRTSPPVPVYGPCDPQDPDAFPTPSRAGGYPHGIPAALWDSPSQTIG